MKLLLYAFVLAVIAAGLSYGQATLTQIPVSAETLQTGFAVITPLSGREEGLSVSEVFAEQIDRNLFQTSVVASPLITLTGVGVSANPAAALDIGIAIVNLNASPAEVTFNLRDQQGVTTAAATMTIEARQQISRFVTEIFFGNPAFPQPLTGLMFISSDLPVAVVALAFNGPGFTALPVASQLSTNNVFTMASPSFSTTIPATPTFNGVPTLLPIPTLTSPSLPVPIAGSTTSLVTSTGLFTAGTQFSAAPAVRGVSTSTFGAAPSLTFVFPQLAFGVGGTGALVLPQVVTGGGWGTQITIANTLPFSQTVRVDFFNPLGSPLVLPFGSTISDIVIGPGGVVAIVL